MNIVRKVGALVIGLTAVVILFAMAPKAQAASESGFQTSAEAVNLAMTNDALNQSGTQGAPQQAVANGWAARDLLEILARQGAEQTNASSPADVDNRPAALLALLVVGVALLLFTKTEYAAGTNTEVVSPTDNTAPLSQSEVVDAGHIADPDRVAQLNNGTEA